jgi:hypothetical protein
MMVNDHSKVFPIGYAIENWFLRKYLEDISSSLGKGIGIVSNCGGGAAEQSHSVHFGRYMPFCQGKTKL